jgi:drug/metabolite transporter (DMT)-like permease
MTKLLIILLIGLVCEAIGVIFLDKGLKQVGEPATITIGEVASVVKRGATNFNILAGVFFEAVFFGTLLVLMSKGSDISFIWPLTALGFVFTTLAAKLILHEEVTLLRWFGVLLILCGAGIITWTEKHKTKPAPSPAVSEAATTAK